MRAATLRDLDLLVRHRRAMWEAIGRGTPSELDAHDRRYRSWVRREVRAGRFAAYVAVEPDGTPLGSGGVWLMPAQPRPARRPAERLPYVLSMYTEPRARGRGVASAIVSALVRWSKARRFPRVTLHASAMGRGVYVRLGFEATNEMRLDLQPGRRRRARPVRRPVRPVRV